MATIIYSLSGEGRGHATRARTVVEALWLGKPVLALPEPGNDEQTINGHFLEASSAGRCVPPDRLDVGTLRDFLARLDKHRATIRGDTLDGTLATLTALRSELPVRSQHTIAEEAGEAMEPLCAARWRAHRDRRRFAEIVSASVGLML